jgi:ABC-type multidrug transport system fused ATPase/permease subunit
MYYGSMENHFARVIKFRRFLGNQVWNLFIVSIFLGLSLFLIEGSFVFVVQGFFRSIGLVPSDRLSLPANYPKSLSSSVAILFLFGLFRSGIYALRFYVNGSTGKAFARLQRERIAKFALKNIDTVETHNVVSQYNDRVNEAAGVLQSISQIVLVGVSSLLFFLMGLNLAPVEMLFGVSALLVGLLPFRILNQRITRCGDEIRVSWDQANRILISGLKNNFLLKIYGLIDQEIISQSRFLMRHEHFLKEYLKISALRGALPNFLGVAVISLITFVSTRYLHTPGIALLSFFYLFIRFAQGLSELHSAFSDFKVGIDGFRQVHRWHLLLDLKDSSVEPACNTEHAGGLSCHLGISVNFKDVDFEYDEGQPVLSGLTFSVSRGEVLLIKGESGVGKSTLLGLVLGVLEPLRGEVRINGEPIPKDRAGLSTEIAYVGPEPYIIIGTLKDNLLFAHYAPEGVTVAEMREALEWAQLNDSRFDLSLHIDEQTPLSTGQKQRIAIARAFLRKPKLLILDEATANLDENTEAAFISAIGPVIPKFTTIVISHKSSFDSMASRKIELYKGGKYFLNDFNAVH